MTWCAFLLAIAVMVGLDQWLKQWSSANLAGGPPRVLLNGVLGLTYFHNTGAAFGLMGGHAWSGVVLVLIPILLLLPLAVYFFYIPMRRKFWLIRVPLLLIIGGGLGNLIDRIRQGFVVDMLEFLFIRFAIFNLADVFITVGCFSLLIVVFFMGKDAPWPLGDKNAAK